MTLGSKPYTLYQVLRHDLPTNGIVYADIGLDMRVVPLDLIPLVPLFCRCLTEMGTTTRDDTGLSDYIRTHTGGVYTTTSTTQKYGKGSVVPEQEVVSNFFMRGKATYGKAGEMFEVTPLYTLNPTPYTLHPTPYTLHPTP